MPALTKFQKQANPSTMDDLLNELRNLAPGCKIELDQAAIDQACTDWRKRYQTNALAVLEPQNTQQIQTIVQWCKKHHLSITTQGGNTGLVGGAVPTPQGTSAAAKKQLVLRSTRLRETLSIDRANLTLTASAGYTLYEIQEFANAHGFLFPLSLASEGTCTLGGNLASNAGGVAVLRYGNTRELCLGLEYIDAQGRVCGDLRGLRKNNTGYDLRHLLIGSEGTLGIITTACMKVFPLPKSRCVAWLNLDHIGAAVEALGFIQHRLFSELSSYEWMNSIAIDVVQTHFPARAPQSSHAGDHVLAEFTSLGPGTDLKEKVTEVLAQLLEEQHTVRNVVLAKNAKEMETFWSLRENISEAQAKEGLNIKHDVACKVSKLPDFHDMALGMIAEYGIDIRPVLFGHLGDGNLHFNLSCPHKQDPVQFLNTHQNTINELVHEAILTCGGTVSAEHGIGQLKAELLARITTQGNYQAFQAIKQALDPDQIFNPGKLVLM